jgi:heme exporter protein CcmB
MSVLRHAAVLAWKDLQVEYRSREILYTMIFFAAMVVLIFSFAFLQEDGLSADVAPGIVLCAVAFAGTLGLGRAFDREREADTMRALLLAPMPRAAIFLGKAVGMVAIMLLTCAVVAPMVWFLFGAPLFRAPLALLATLLLTCAGFAVVGAVFAAMLLRSRSRDVLLPVVLYPILVPLFIAAAKALAGLLEPVPALGTTWFWCKFLLVFDAAFVVAGLWFFESLVIE